MEQWLIINSMAVWLALLGNFLLTFALIRKVNGISRPGRNVGQPMHSKEFLKVSEIAPDFEAETLSGERVTLADYAQRKVAFLFMSPGCRPCREAAPTLEELQPKAAQAGVTLCLVITAERDQAQAFVTELAISLPVLVTSPGGQFQTDYKVGGTPFYCLVDEQGHVEATGFFDNAWQTLTGQWAHASRWDEVPTSAMLEGAG